MSYDKASYFIYWTLGIAWMVIGVAQQAFGDKTQGLIDVAIGVEFLILARLFEGKKISNRVKNEGGRMSEYERYSGQMYNLEPTLLNRTAAERIDDYQMRIYEIVKTVFPDAIGYSAECTEEPDDSDHVKTRFRVHRKPIRLGDKK